MKNRMLATWLTTAALAGATLPAAAQLSLESLPPDLLMPASLNTPTPRLQPIWPALRGERRSPQFESAHQWLLGGLLIEPARLVDGHYVRPRYSFGMRSESLRSFLRSAGIEAQSCMLPVVRARANLSGEGEGAIWLSMRCTLD